jgi:3-oxoacyl-[acyl-carrier-protein] synthase-3
MTNQEFESLVDTTDEWILQRTGIRERRISGPDEPTSKFCIEAANKALKSAGVEGREIELVVVATVTGDYPWPSTACIVQEAIGAKNAGAFDISAACAGFIYGLSTVTAMVEAGEVRKALMIGGDTLTKIVDWSDRSTCILFGDGAAGCVVGAQRNTDRGVIATILRSDGTGVHHILYERGGSKWPASLPESANITDKLFMAGREVYRFAVTAMGDACEAVLLKANMCVEQVDLFVPHQANLRIIEAAARRLSLPDEKVFINVDRYGNTSGGSIPLALDEAVQEGRLKPGMVVMTVGFGAGLVWGANLIRW